MQVVESTDFYLRVIKLDFSSRDPELRLQFRILPMFHIGTEQYYRQVFDQLRSCHEIIYEGVASKKSNDVTRHYRRFAGNLGLVTQNEVLKMNELPGKLIHADFTHETGAEEWRKLRFYDKLKMRVLHPLKMYYYSRNMDRRKLVKEFMPSAEENWMAYGPLEDEAGSMWNYIITARDNILRNTVRQKLEQEGRAEKLIGVVYGAAHMKVVIRLLIDQYRYVPEKPEFLEVFQVR
ncbi:hypothetical protein [Flavilitoribacter nigricans]|uniref:Uncharacterized protein n=1 Tax=Flavilitoribacter nigricans (strain ATCC 23147 / DSM 23189 / NBRC 102662 / NCIMB 1420 / SS-2) TaxID=1122177 RepID=A0A2D0NFE1_FLAN2|nr:hypothetical protein [Flavilitoribacter nigricans]PHN07197.1 hypothetical protein CRP01_08220 [Flavilitoribacter nigricans DSM 23189 = NBRC 102662]